MAKTQKFLYMTKKDYKFLILFHRNNLKISLISLKSSLFSALNKKNKVNSVPMILMVWFYVVVIIIRFNPIIGISISLKAIYSLKTQKYKFVDFNFSYPPQKIVYVPSIKRNRKFHFRFRLLQQVRPK